MAKARQLAPDLDALAAMRYIKEFKLSADQIKYRYTVAHIDKMCFEIGIPPTEGQIEVEKIYILLKALCVDTTEKEFTDPDDQKAIARLRHAKQIADQKDCC